MLSRHLLRSPLIHFRHGTSKPIPTSPAKIALQKTVSAIEFVNFSYDKAALQSYDNLPARFQSRPWNDEEMERIQLGGAF